MVTVHCALFWGYALISHRRTTFKLCALHFGLAQHPLQVPGTLCHEPANILRPMHSPQAIFLAYQALPTPSTICGSGSTMETHFHLSCTSTALKTRSVCPQITQRTKLPQSHRMPLRNPAIILRTYCIYPPVNTHLTTPSKPRAPTTQASHT